MSTEAGVGAMIPRLISLSGGGATLSNSRGLTRSGPTTASGIGSNS